MFDEWWHAEDIHCRMYYGSISLRMKLLLSSPWSTPPKAVVNVQNTHIKSFYVWGLILEQISSIWIQFSTPFMSQRTFSLARFARIKFNNVFHTEIVTNWLSDAVKKLLAKNICNVSYVCYINIHKKYGNYFKRSMMSVIFRCSLM